jgi:hypothetical protein
MLKETKADTFSLIRTQLCELVHTLAEFYKRLHVHQSASNQCQITNFIKDICENGLQLKLSQFQLGKYLFSRKEEIERLRHEVFKLDNPEAILFSHIFRDII